MKRGMPAVVVCTAQFRKLAQSVMRARRVPPSIAIEIDCNPEFVDDARLAQIADAVADAVADRLTREHVTSAERHDARESQ